MNLQTFLVKAIDFYDSHPELASLLEEGVPELLSPDADQSDDVCITPKSPASDPLVRHKKGVHTSLRARLAAAAPARLDSIDFSQLVFVGGSEYLAEESFERGRCRRKRTQSFEFKINSGGQVFFLLFRANPPEECLGSDPSPSSSPPETVACLKFTPSRLQTQSEMLGCELAEQMGLSVPKSLLLFNSKAEERWSELRSAVERLQEEARGDQSSSSASGSGDENEEPDQGDSQLGGGEGVLRSESRGSFQQVCKDLACRLDTASSALLMQFIRGQSLLNCDEAFEDDTLESTCFALGHVFLVDMVLGNSDRLPCKALGWRGNPNNLLYAPGSDTLERRTPRLVAIDTGVARRPPSFLVEAEAQGAEACAELLMTGLNTAQLLAAFHLHPTLKLTHHSGTRLSERAHLAFQAGFSEAISAAAQLEGILGMILSSLGEATSAFFAHIRTGSDPDGSTKADLSPPGPEEETLEGLQEKGFDKTMGRTKQFTILKDEAADSEDFEAHLQKWNAFMEVEMSRIRKAVDEWREKRGVKAPLSTAFLTPKPPMPPSTKHHSFLALVDAYELEVRLKHLLKRVAIVLRASQCKLPSMILPDLFLGNALCAQSYHTLSELKITHIVTLAPELDLQVPSQFTHVKFEVEDTEAEENEILGMLRNVSEVVALAQLNGGSVLVHCFEGRSRSATAVIAHLMLSQEPPWDLARAHEHVQKLHPDTRPNPYFCKALNTLNQEIFGPDIAAVSLIKEGQRRKRPEPKLCPVCGVSVGISADSVASHVRSHHRTEV